MAKRSIRDIEVQGKRALVRVDFNVPLRNGAVAEDTRIRAALPTMQYLLDRGAGVIACSHLGRPEGRVRDDLRLAPVARRLEELLGRPVQMARESVGPEVEAAAKALPPGAVLLLENLRFHAEEEANDPTFARQLARLADLYVNDAFGAAHRAHASTEGVAHLLPSAAGLLMERELERLANVFRPEAGRRAVISGGAKVSDKLRLLQHLAPQVNVLCIGGAMAHTFLLAQGVPMGASLAEPDLVEDARAILKAAKQHGCELLLPVDGVVAASLETPPRARPVLFAEEEVPEGWMVLDIGPRTVEQFGEALRTADLVVWNGPLGRFENPAYAGGSTAIARLLAELPAETIVCGGETVQVVQEAGVAERMTHISTGGGAALELLEGRTLPGVAALPDRA